MIHRVVIARRAEHDMQAAARWWAAERSAEQARRWLADFEKRLTSLARDPKRWPLIAEHARSPYELWELHFGFGRSSTHRAIFTIADELVLVLAIRHLAQDELEVRDLE